MSLPPTLDSVIAEHEYSMIDKRLAEIVHGTRHYRKSHSQSIGEGEDPYLAGEFSFLLLQRDNSADVTQEYP